MSLDTKAKLHAAIDSKQTSTFQDAIDTAKSTAPDTTDEIAKQVAMDKGGQTGFQTWVANLTPTQTAALTAAGVAVTICLIIVLIYFLYDPTLPPSPGTPSPGTPSPGTPLGTPSPGTPSPGTPSPGTPLGTPSPGTPLGTPSCVATPICNNGSSFEVTPQKIQDISSDGQIIITPNYINDTIDIYNNCGVKQFNFPASYDYHSLDIAISGDGQTIIYSNMKMGMGEVYIYNINGVRISTIIPDQSLPVLDSKRFGSSVDISYDGQTIIIGHSIHPDGGHVYIYRRNGNTITQIDSFTNPSIVIPHYFGSTVAISGDGQIYAVCDWGDDTVYIYDINRVELAALTATATGTSQIAFGGSMGISYNGEIIAIGACAEENKGYVYLYHRNGNTITQVARFTSNIAGSQYGWSVSISGDGSILVVGAPGPWNAINAGLVYMYDIDTSSGMVTKLYPVINPINANTKDFGSSVSTSHDGKTTVIGDNECFYIHKNN